MKPAKPSLAMQFFALKGKTNAVVSKRKNFERYGDGSWGNNLRQWDSFGNLVDSGYRLPVTMRYNGSSGGGWCKYDVPFHDIPALIQQWQKEGAEYSRIFFNEAAPNHKAKLQGELVQDGRWGYALHYSTLPLPMRDALRLAPQNHLGPGALLILRQLLTPSSYEDLRAILDNFPDSAIELSIFSVCVGSVPGRNAIIWEVRNY